MPEMVADSLVILKRNLFRFRRQLRRDSLIRMRRTYADGFSACWTLRQWL